MVAELEYGWCFSKTQLLTRVLQGISDLTQNIRLILLLHPTGDPSKAGDFRWPSPGFKREGCRIGERMCRPRH